MGRDPYAKIRKTVKLTKPEPEPKPKKSAKQLAREMDQAAKEAVFRKAQARTNKDRRKLPPHEGKHRKQK
jgi:hypothetical protein